MYDELTNSLVESFLKEESNPWFRPLFEGLCRLLYSIHIYARYSCFEGGKIHTKKEGLKMAFAKTLPHMFRSWICLKTIVIVTDPEEKRKKKIR